MPYQNKNPLVKWCLDNGISQRKAAEILDVNHQLFRAQCASLRGVSWKMAKHYEYQTEGELSAYDLMEFFEQVKEWDDA